MKKAIAAAFIAVALLSWLLVGCVGGVVTGSRNLETREFNFSDFTRVEVSSAFEVEIAQSDSYSISVTADENLFDYIVVSQQGAMLQIRLKTARYIGTTQRASITMPDLYGLELSGATHGAVQGFGSSHDFTLELSGASSLSMVDMTAGDIRFDISGASRVTGDMTAGDADFDISGASTVELQGSGGDIVADTSGASSIKLADFPVNNANVKLSGASNGTVNLDGRLDANLSGASRLTYVGEPTMGSITTSGGSMLGER